MTNKLLPALVITGLIAHLSLRMLLADDFVLHTDFEILPALSQTEQAETTGEAGSAAWTPAHPDGFPVSFNSGTTTKELLGLQSMIRH